MDERDINVPIGDARVVPVLQVEMSINEDTQFQKKLTRNLQIKNKEYYLSLQNALIDHIWENYGIITIMNNVFLSNRM